LVERGDLAMAEKITLGISSCLLGQEVRYDGGHKLDRYLRDTLGQFVEYVPVCPEVECGLPIPREAMRLIGDPDAPRLITNKTKIDHTDKMKGWGVKRLAELDTLDLCGYIFKSRSPSSGMARVKVYDEQGMPSRYGSGIWAKMFMDRFPFLPVEDEGRLHDPKLREMFIERIFMYKRWRDSFADEQTMGGLVEFHTRNKMLVLSHSQDIYRQMGKLVGDGKKMDKGKLFDEYFGLLAKAMGLKTTIKKNRNVLQHMIGYFKKDLTSDEKQEFDQILDQYGQGQLPLIVPVTLINHYVRKFKQPYLGQQYYLNPHPQELSLRNHA
jgi:uncharacterized protein YbgA (DUF1722 family)/uncharacterized protein YbbK (DUF523 family)